MHCGDELVSKEARIGLVLGYIFRRMAQRSIFKWRGLPVGLDIIIGVHKMSERFERHRQAWTPAEVQKLHMLVGKGMSLKAIAKSLTRSEESTKNKAKQDKLKIQKLR